MTHDEKRKRFWTVVDAVHERNKDVDPGRIEADVDAAIEEVRNANARSLKDVLLNGPDLDGIDLERDRNHDRRCEVEFDR